MGTGTPTVRRRRLGSELRRLREEAKLKHEDAMTHLGCSQGKISQIERGRTGIKKLELQGLLDFYKVDPTTADELLELRTQASRRTWWQEFSTALPEGFGTYVDLESEASSAQVHENLLIPGILQTEDYMRSLVASNLPECTSAEIDHLVALRLARRQAITRAEAPLQLWIVLDEAALQRPVGGCSVMRTQLDYLVEACHSPTHSIQVLPFNTGAYAGMRGAFSVFEFPHPADPEVVYVDCPAGNIYLEEAWQIREHKRQFSHLQVAALDQPSTVRLIQRTMKGMA